MLRAVRRCQVTFGEEDIAVDMLAVLLDIPVWILQCPGVYRHVEDGTTCAG